MRGPASDLAACAAGYAIGSLPFGVWLGRAAAGVDPREHGSHSMGTTNVLRTAGPAAAGAVFGLDVAKGAVAVLGARALGAGSGGQVAAGVAAVVGHSWPVFAGFQGGKGVATAFGGLIVLSPEGTVSAIAGGVTALLATRIVSVGSLVAAGSAAAGAGAAWALRGRGAGFAFAAPAATLVAVRHAGNIGRLLRGSEPRVRLRRRRAV